MLILLQSQLNEKLSELTASHQSIVSQKDKQLSEHQKQIETLQKAESELTKLIDEQKAKNNVSSADDKFPPDPHSNPSIRLPFYKFKVLTIYFSLFLQHPQTTTQNTHQDLRTKNWKLVEALQTAQSSPAKPTNVVVSAPTAGRPNEC